jgi:hypothetical protein
MRCPRCGNEVGPNEAFCGQCGMPTPPSPQSTGMANAPTPHSGMLGSYNPHAPSLRTNTYHSGPVPPGLNVPSTQYTPGTGPGAYPSPMGPTSPQPATGFYQEPTEAMSALSPNPPTYPTTYHQPGFPDASMSGSYSGPYGPPVQPFQTGNYPGSAYQQAPFVTRQGYEYGMHGRLPQPSQKSSSSLPIIIACLCAVIALIIFAGLGALYLMKTRSAPPVSHPQPTAAPTVIATLAPTPTPIPSPTPTMEPTSTPAPSPTPIPTPSPDTGFQWCDSICASNGFSVEYPMNWQVGPATTTNVIQFLNPDQPDVYAAFKALGPVSGNATDLINTDLQTGFASQPGYVAPTSTSTTTISGETWAAEVAYYEGKVGTDGMPTKERVEVFAIVHQGNGYIIELQAPDAHFDDVNTQSFENMIGRFQFLQSTT